MAHPKHAPPVALHETHRTARNTADQPHRPAFATVAAAKVQSLRGADPDVSPAVFGDVADIESLQSASRHKRVIAFSVGACDDHPFLMADPDIARRIFADGTDLPQIDAPEPFRIIGIAVGAGIVTHHTSVEPDPDRAVGSFAETYDTVVGQPSAAFGRMAHGPDGVAVEKVEPVVSADEHPSVGGLQNRGHGVLRQTVVHAQVLEREPGVGIGSQLAGCERRGSQKGRKKGREEDVFHIYRRGLQDKNNKHIGKTTIFISKKTAPTPAGIRPAAAMQQKNSLMLQFE